MYEGVNSILPVMSILWNLTREWRQCRNIVIFDVYMKNISFNVLPVTEMLYYLQFTSAKVIWVSFSLDFFLCFFLSLLGFCWYLWFAFCWSLGNCMPDNIDRIFLFIFSLLHRHLYIFFDKKKSFITKQSIYGKDVVFIQISIKITKLNIFITNSKCKFTFHVIAQSSHSLW